MAELEASGVRRSEDTGGLVIVGRTAAKALEHFPESGHRFSEENATTQWNESVFRFNSNRNTLYRTPNGPARRFLAAHAEVGYIRPAITLLIGRARINPSFRLQANKAGRTMPWQ
jgi:hypothetical protein